MKKKIYFITTSIIQIITSIYCIIISNNIVQSQLESFKNQTETYPDEFQQRLIDLFTNNGSAIIICTAIIIILLNIIIIRIALKNNILKKKGSLVAMSIFSFILSNSQIIGIVALLNLLVLMALKRTNPEDFPAPKKDIPKIEYQKSTKKEKLFGVLLIGAYFSQLLFDFIDVSQNRLLGFIIVITFYLTIFILSIVIFKDTLKRDFKLLKENAESYFRYILPKLGIMYLIYFSANIICASITQNPISQNEETLRTLPKWFLFPLAIIWAPIVEELVFRGVLRRFIKNNTLYILSSAIIFGLLHTYTENSLFNVFIMAIPYSVLGGYLAFVYTKTNNIYSNILSHSFHNTIASIFSTLLA